MKPISVRLSQNQISFLEKQLEKFGIDTMSVYIKHLGLMFSDTSIDKFPVAQEMKELLTDQSLKFRNVLVYVTDSQASILKEKAEAMNMKLPIFLRFVCVEMELQNLVRRS